MVYLLHSLKSRIFFRHVLKYLPFLCGQWNCLSTIFWFYVIIPKFVHCCYINRLFIVIWVFFISVASKLLVKSCGIMIWFQYQIVSSFWLWQVLYPCIFSHFPLSSQKQRYSLTWKSPSQNHFLTLFLVYYSLRCMVLTIHLN